MKPLSSSRSFTALLCLDSPDILEASTSQLTALGFEVHTVTSAETAVSHLHSHIYDVVAVEEEFCGADVETHPILAELGALALDTRRTIFVVLIGPTRSTGNDMEAFALGVDLVIGCKDVPNFKALVGQGISQHEAFYAVYNSVVQRVQEEGLH